MPLMSTAPWNLDRLPPDVAIVCALVEEFEVLVASLPERPYVRKHAQGGYDYFWIEPRSGYRCVGSFSGMLQSAAADRVAARLLDYRPAILIRLEPFSTTILRPGDVLVDCSDPQLASELQHLAFVHPAAFARWRDSVKNRYAASLRSLPISEPNLQVWNSEPHDQLLPRLAILGSVREGDFPILDALSVLDLLFELQLLPRHPSISPTSQPNTPALRIHAIDLDAIRCFDRIALQLDGIDWVLLVGDNAAGKSTLLRAIALGLCLESEAAALLEAIPGRMIRHGHTRGTIKITLSDEVGKTYESVTEIAADESGTNGQERVRRIKDEVPAGRVFACGYGTARTRVATHSHESYGRFEALRSLVDDNVTLQNPELVLRRQDEEPRRRAEHKLLDILMLDSHQSEVTYSTAGLQIRGPWAGGEQIPADLATLSDGYRSTSQWILDLIGWLVHDGRFARDEDLTGIVLIDELEQHLHPRWQRHIITLLRRHFPKLQFVASTHTPLLVSSLADHERSKLVTLMREDGQIHARLRDAAEFRGMRADQVLTSIHAFALPTSRSPGSSSDLDRYAELLGKPRTPDEDAELERLRVQLKASLLAGETERARRVEAALRESVLTMLGDEPPDLELEAELCRQLGPLLDEDDEDGEP